MDVGKHIYIHKGELFKINHQIFFEGLVYLLPSNACQKQYTQKVVGTFKLRWKDYKESNRNFLWIKNLHKIIYFATL